jgi:organic hydroperoxide reductase OsmC/OhrA
MPVARTHTYEIRTTWRGNRGSGTSSYTAYSRDHEIAIAGKAAPLPGSSDAAFRGDASRYSPEELLVSALSGCHMLWFLHLCADAGISVTAYEDSAHGVMRENADGSGAFVDVVLNPEVSLADASRTDEAEQLHHKAHAMCFIARSVNFPVSVRPAWIRSSKCHTAAE